MKSAVFYDVFMLFVTNLDNPKKLLQYIDFQLTAHCMYKSPVRFYYKYEAHFINTIILIQFDTFFPDYLSLKTIMTFYTHLLERYNNNRISISSPKLFI